MDLSNQKASTACLPNAVFVTAQAKIYMMHISDFASDAGICRAFGRNCTRLGVVADMPVLATAYPTQARICYCRDRDSEAGQNRFISTLFDQNTTGDVLICGYEKGRPAPLSAEDARGIAQGLAKMAVHPESRCANAIYVNAYGKLSDFYIQDLADEGRVAAAMGWNKVAFSPLEILPNTAVCYNAEAAPSTRPDVISRLVKQPLRGPLVICGYKNNYCVPFGSAYETEEMRMELEALKMK